MVDRDTAGVRGLFARLLYPLLLALVAANTIGMTYSIPLVLKEAQVNAGTRIPFEENLARMLDSFPPGAPILMADSDHIGALQDAGIPLKQTINESDYYSWRAALRNPADSAEFVIAFAGDPVSKAVAEHPEGLDELTILCGTGQPCARIYQSERFTGKSANP